MRFGKPSPHMFVFYAGVLHSECYVFPKLADLGIEVYNGCWVWVSTQVKPAMIFEKPGWYRGDKTPYPTEQVPPELRAYALLLT